MGDRAAKTALFDEFARAAKALASGRRIELLDVLANGERTVEALAGEVGLTVANTSQHLQILRQAGLVSSRRKAPRSITGWPGRRCSSSGRTLRTLAASRLAEVERLAAAYLGGRDELEPVTREELARRLQDGDDLVVLDVRPAAEYAAGHLPGAVSIPVAELRRRLAELPADRGGRRLLPRPYCAFAHRPWSCCARRALRPGGWRTGSPNGRPPAWPSPALTTDPPRSPPCLPFTRSSTKAWATAPMWSSWATGGPWSSIRPGPHPYLELAAGGGSRSPMRPRPTCTPTS